LDGHEALRCDHERSEIRMSMQIRQRTGDPDDIRASEGNIIVEIDKGAGGRRWVEAPKSALKDLSNRGVVELAIKGLGPGDPFASDTQTMLSDSSFSLERIENGVQTQWVRRDETVDADAIEQERIRFALSRDHVGGGRN
jgi:hypothetical protein